MKWKGNASGSRLTVGKAKATVFLLNDTYNVWGYTATLHKKELRGMSTNKDLAKAAAEKAIEAMRKERAK